MISLTSLSALGLPPARGAGGGFAAQLDAQTAAGLHALRFKLSDTSSLWLASDETGGNITADGQTIGKADDQTANALDFLQANTPQEPTFKVLTNGGKTFNAIRGDGSDDILTGSPSIYANGAAAFVFGLQGAAQTSRAIYLEGSTASNSPLYAIYTGGTDNSTIRLIIINDAGSIVLNVESSVPALDGSPHVVTILDIGTGYEYRIDRAAAGSGSYSRAGTLTLNSASLLASKRVSQTQYLAGDICDEFIAFEPGWTEAQIALAEAKIAANIGATLAS